MNSLSPNKKNGIPTHEADKRDTQTSPRTRKHPHTSHTRDKNKKKHLDLILSRPTTTKARTSKEYVSQPPLLKDPARMPPARVPVLQVTKTEIPGRRGPPRHRDKGGGPQPLQVPSPTPLSAPPQLPGPESRFGRCV